jgi:flagellar protein FlgJ
MRARDADLLGYERGSPEWRQFVVTGEMPEPPKPGYTRMTPEQVATIPGLDPAKAYQVSPEGKIETIGGGGTTVNIDNAGGKFEEAFAKGDATTIETVYNAGLAASRNIARIDQLGALLDANPTGMGASIKQFAGTLGIPTDGLDEIQAAQALINSLVPEQRQPGSGPMSDADLALFKQSLPQLINQPGGNKLIVETMRAIAQYDAEGARIVQRLRAGELDRAGAFAALQNRVNPLAAVSGSTGDGTAPPPAAAPGGVIKYDQNGNVIP